jgi:hypothetical protein
LLIPAFFTKYRNPHFCVRMNAAGR